jgi:hypothetical protein
VGACTHAECGVCQLGGAVGEEGVGTRVKIEYRLRWREGLPCGDAV